MMLKFLTHKLRTQTLNDQQPYLYKNEEEHDSGTESDGEAEETEQMMESEVEHSVSPASSHSCSPEIVGGACSPPVPPIAVSPYFLDSALPSDSDHNYDHHSSEEELEVINSHVNMHHRHHHRKHTSSLSSSCAQPAPASCDAAATPTAGASTNNTTAPPAYPEKRKWSQVVTTTPCDGENNNNNNNNNTTRIESSGSSDEEVQGLMAAMATPVEFRTSPPLDAHKPGHKSVRSLSPPPKLFHFSPTPLTTTTNTGAALEVSPRKRHHRGPPRAHHIQRPCLDFEKMQQLKARAVTAWRHSGEHGGGELSVFCW